ncbi:MAG: glycoside hydrolase family 20 zincin-like fold domain-containing protein [Actinomycetota bacterium]
MSAIAPAPSSLEDLVLLPRPRSLAPGSGDLRLGGAGSIVCAGPAQQLAPVARVLQGSLQEEQAVSWPLVGGGAEAEGGAVLSLDEGLPPEGYGLRIGPEGIELAASDPAGAYYGVMTMAQILRQVRGLIPGLVVEDHPDFATRGVMLDISRDKVPKPSTLFELVDMLAGWKINHLELYVEHTFAYRNHEEVWAQASPLTGEEILELDSYCRQRFVELVPNQNSFGHMHRWLRLPRYRHLAECPEGSESPRGTPLPPYSLDPTNEECLEFLDGIYAELLPHFTSSSFNVGCDETFDLGRGKSREACEQKGAGRVYLDFLLKVYELVKRHGLTMHFWGDIIVNHPDLIDGLPKDGVALEWGYEADHPFDEHLELFARSGIPFFACPGTASWNSIAGRTQNCLANIDNAVSSGLRHGARGVLNTDWGDRGHWQYLPVSYLGLAAGAALGWSYESNRDRDLIPALDLHAFRDEARVMGRVAHDLGNAYLRAGAVPHNSSALFHTLRAPDRGSVPDGVSEESLKECADVIRSAVAPLGSARMARADSGIIEGEFANAARMLLHACTRGTALLSDDNSSETRRELGRELREILGRHRELWVARNRIGGLHDSIWPLEALLDDYTGYQQERARYSGMS